MDAKKVMGGMKMKPKDTKAEAEHAAKQVIEKWGEHMGSLPATDKLMELITEALVEFRDR
jgi:hypothetical protein